jgi:putative transposase
VTDIQDVAGAAEVDEEQEARLAKEALESLAAEKRLAELVSPEAVDRMLGDAEAAGIAVDGPGGLLGQITKAVLERALGAELDDHLGYVRGDPAGNGSGNSRNGFHGKTVTTTAGPVQLQVPRDRNSTFAPVIVPKGQRRLGQVDDMILSLYARGMTTRDIQAHLAEVYGAAVSPALISKVTDVVAEEITAWQTRPLDSFYAIVYIDALMVKVRDGGAVDNKAAYLVTGVDIDGFKHVLGIWIAAAEGAKFQSGATGCATAASRTSCSSAATG